MRRGTEARKDQQPRDGNKEKHGEGDSYAKRVQAIAGEIIPEQTHRIEGLGQVAFSGFQTNHVDFGKPRQHRHPAATSKEHKLLNNATCGTV